MLEKVAIKIVRGYQLAISPLLGPSCRFSPTCSQYAIDAMRQHGLIKGIVLAVIRLSKCHPFHAGGFDPVPETKTKQK